ncbi:MAG: hypothetical protein RL380_1051 [Verrucomicrobiota bacterium]|jgi:hypothetical protein
MNTLRPTFLTLAAMLCFAATFSVRAGTTNAPAATNTVAVAASTNDYRSNFDLKARDPFYPHSARAAIGSTDDSGSEASPTVILVLKGISGSAKRRCAIINDHTFMVGDESEVSIGSGRIRVRCHEIRADAAIVSLGTSQEKTELRMPIRY